MTAPLVVAHLGGVPEVATVVLPLAVFAGFVLLEKRARARERAEAARAGQDPEQRG